MSGSLPFSGTPLIGGVNLGGNGNIQLHLHGTDRDHLSGAYYKDLSTGLQVLGSPVLNGYEAAMADLRAQQTGLKRF